MPVFNMVRDNSNPFKAGHIEKNVTGSRFWSLRIKEKKSTCCRQNWHVIK